MGFTSIDDYIHKVTSGNTYRCDFQRNAPEFSAGVAGHWYDSFLANGNPQPGGGGWLLGHGNRVAVSRGMDSLCGWNPDPDWYVAFNYLIGYSAVAHPLGATSSIYQTVDIVAGVYYEGRLSWLDSSGGDVTLTLGGTTLTLAIPAGSGTQPIGLVAGATDSLFKITVPATHSIFFYDGIGLLPDVSFTPYNDDQSVNCGGLPHGGDVYPLTKHIVNVGVASASASFAPCSLMLIDVLGCYPSLYNWTAGTYPLDNTRSLPRYTNGVGVYAYIVPHFVNAVAQVVQISYTNSDGVPDRSLPQSVSCPGGYFNGHISNSGGLANNIGPFLPLSPGDKGIRSVQSVTYDVGGASAYPSLVLCRPLLTLPLTSLTFMSERNYLNEICSMPRVYDGACLNWLFCAGAGHAATSTFHGYIDFVWG